MDSHAYGTVGCIHFRGKKCSKMELIMTIMINDNLPVNINKSGGSSKTK